MLKDKIINREAGILTYGITPPKLEHSTDKIAEIAAIQLARMQLLAVDALVVYDIQDENDRTSEARPFPFLPTMDAGEYCDRYLGALSLPKIIYRCVGKYTADSLRSWILNAPDEDKYSVFVGASSGHSTGLLRLPDAYDTARDLRRNFYLGGVTIPERHTKKADEHLRVFRKMQNGCEFFISQAVYNVESAKSFLSDYYYLCHEKNVPMVPVIFTLTPCGSQKTLAFMRWLGISVPRWLENELIHSDDILAKSMDLSLRIFEELWNFAREKNIPVGCNIESVSVRKEEIDASVVLVTKVRDIMDSSANGSVRPG
jgi:hypothetical protein